MADGEHDPEADLAADSALTEEGVEDLVACVEATSRRRLEASRR